MSHVNNYNRPCYRSEVKSKIGDYIRGKISAQSLMHPSRVNTKPIDKRKYNLHSGFHYEATPRASVTDYQKKIRRPPLKDYIEGKVKLCDMISPSKITYIPKERKYQNLFPPGDGGGPAGAASSRDQQHHHHQQHQRHRTVSFADSVETVTTVHRDYGGGGGGVNNRFKDEWEVGKCHPLLAKTTTNGGGGGNRNLGDAIFNGNHYSLVPIRSAACGPSGKRKLMCKIKVQRGADNSHGGGAGGGAGAGAEVKTEEHIIEIPEKILRRGGHHSLPKFLMDRYNIPCYVNGATAAAAAASASAAKHQSTRRKQQLSILDVTGSSEANVWGKNGNCGGSGGAGSQRESPLPDARRGSASAAAGCKRRTRAIEYPLVADGESAVSRYEAAGADSSSGKNNANNSDVENVPSEQGDYNNATTYVFEFYEEDEEEVPGQETESAIIEEVEEDQRRGNRWGYGGGGTGARSYADEARFNGGRCHIFDESLRSDDGFQPQQHYEEFKSDIYVQRELMDLHRGMLKCDKNFMAVERNVNQVMATLNALESAQNREIKPSVVDVKLDNEKMRLQLQTLAAENEELKKSVQHLRKKTTDYDKVIYYMRQDSSAKMQELQSKLETLTQTQVKSIEMQNTVNKNLVQITHGMKRAYTEQDSRHCCNSIKSHKNSNLTIS